MRDRKRAGERGRVEFRTGEWHAYPRDLAPFVRKRWDEVAALPDGSGAADDLPGLAVLEGLLSACYQASLLREEERPVTFRLILAAPDRLPPDGGPPTGLHRLEFPEARLFDVEELRRLSPAADFSRSLVDAELIGGGEPRIWGLVHSGPRWVRSVAGGRGASPGLPPGALVVRVPGPGRVEVCKGPVVVAGLDEGRLVGPARSVYESRWLPGAFAPVRAELRELHVAALARAREPWAALDPDLPRKISQHMVRRLIASVRGSRHGGIVIIVPADRTEEFSGENRYVQLKYGFSDGQPRRRFRALIVELMNTLAAVYGGTPTRTVGWDEYEASRDRSLADLEEAIFEFSHLIAGLSAVDGAVVMTQRFELLGFGGEISGGLPDVGTVARALDPEGDRVVEEPTKGVGTRHRSAYRLVGALPGAIAVVVSQDGNARFVALKDGTVTYWDQT